MLNLVQLFKPSTIPTEMQAPQSVVTKSAVVEENLISRHLAFHKEAIVTEAIEPQKAGRVKFQGSWWPARCIQEICLNPGDVVYVVDRKNITLYVELVPMGSGG